MSVATDAGLDTVATLRTLLDAPSPTGDVALATRLLAELATEAGYAAEIDPAGNVVMTWGDLSDGVRDSVLLLGHLDTVPGDIPVREVAGRLRGRGAVDAKGPLAAALVAVTRLPRSGAPITVVAAPDEEGASRGAAALCARPAPRHLIVLEPSGWDTITVGYRGCVRLRVSLAQPAAHHALPRPSAADRLVQVLSALRDELSSPPDARSVEQVQTRVNALSSVDDGLTERAGAAVEIRVPAGLSVLDVTRRVAEVATGADITIVSACDAVHVPRSNPAVRELARSVTAAGGSPRYTVKTGTSDLNVVLPAWRCPAAVYGPGDCSLDHTGDEAIDLDELRTGASVLEQTLRSLR